MISSPVLILDMLTRLAPLGLRFMDDATAQPCGAGLDVSAYPPGQPWRRVQAQPNASGVYVFQHLPGLEAAERGAGDEAYWQAISALQKPFQVEVSDPRGRFLPVSLALMAPYKGVYSWLEPASLPSPAASAAPGMIPLFAAPAHPIPPGMALLRADLAFPSGAPAAWTLLEAWFNGRRLGRSLADDQGRLVMFFAYPPLPDFASSVGSPASSSGPAPLPLSAQTWPVELRAFNGLPGSPPAAPDLSALLVQAPVHLWASLSPLQPLPPQDLPYGRELVLKTAGSSFLILSSLSPL